MNNVIITVAVVSAVFLNFVSVILSIIRTVIAWKRANEPEKDEIWETTVKMICNNQPVNVSCEEFAETYEKLKAFRDNGCKIEGIPPITDTENKPIFTVARKDRQ